MVKLFPDVGTNIELRGRIPFRMTLRRNLSRIDVILRSEATKNLVVRIE
jgi:hypothetical protein